MVTERIETLLAEKFAEEEFADCFLIEIKQTGKKVEVFMDSDSGVTFDTCQQVSRFLEQHIDEGGWLGEDYVLEVSSPGVGRPLQQKRQYPRNVGRAIEVTLAGGGVREGTLAAVGEQHITIEEKIRRKEGKKTKTETVRTDIPFDAIRKAIIKVSFN